MISRYLKECMVRRPYFLVREQSSYAVGIYQLLSNLDCFGMGFLFRFARCANRLYKLRIFSAI